MKIDYKTKKELLKKENVIGFGLGKKVVKGKKTNKNCITILVLKKQPLNLLASSDVVPEKINKIQTDIVEVGIIRALSDRKTSIQSSHHTTRYRPAIGGISIGHKDITAGTLGCIVYKDNYPYILSNNHVLANSNSAQNGDPILQPGPYDGGTTEKDEIAKLDSFVEIKFEFETPKCPIANATLSILNFFTKIFKPHYTWQLSHQATEANYVDAAIAKPLSQELVKDDILEIGIINDIAKPSIGMKVQKSGRTTGYTTGTIEVLDATVRVSYGEGKTAVFEEQIVAGPISKGGDSGSAVLDMDNNIIGLLFAGSEQTTVINPIDKVFELLSVNLK